MKDKRTWKIQINLDEFNALCGAAFTESERSALLGGLQLGCNNGTLPEHCSNIVRTAFEAALGWRQETEGFRLKQSGAGKASAEARKVKFGSANPNAVRTDLEHSSNLTNNQQPSNPKPNNPSTQEKKKPSTKNVITSFLEGEESSRAFGVIWKNWPKRVDGKPSKGERGRAERCFQAIVDSGAASPEELVRCAEIYASSHPNVKDGFVKHVSTFLSLEAGTWVECLDIHRSRRNDASSN